MTKKELRSEIKTVLESLPFSYLEKAGEKIESAVISSEIFRKSEYVFIYVNTPKEPSTSKIITAALNCGKKVYVPKCVDKGIMIPVRINSLSDLVPGAYNIPEPVVSDDEGAGKITLAIVPCVSASRDGRRLGHGGGYYDRFLENSNIFKLCICFEELINDNIPVSEFDVRMNAVFTEKEKMIF